MFDPIFFEDSYFTNGNMKPADDGDDLGGGDSTDSPTPTAPILSGQPAAAPAMPITGQDPSQVTPPAPAAPPAPDQGATYTSDVQAPPMPVAGSPSNANIPLPRNSRATVGVSADGTSIIPQATGQPSVWKQIVLGALIGATAGGRGFAQGAQNGGAKVEQMQQNQRQQVQDQQKLAFESVQSANEMIRARNEARAADDAHEEHAQTLATQQTAAQERLEELGVTPKLTIAGDNPASTHAQATGGLQTLANQNGGTIPRIATTNAPDSTSDDGKTHTIHVYNVNPQDIQSNPNGTLDLINDHRRVLGLPDMSQSDLQIMGGQKKPGNWRAGAADMANDALQSIYTVPTPDAEPAKNAAEQAHLQQQLDTYKQNPNANPGTVKALQAQLDAFSKAAESARAITATGKSNTTLETAPADAEAARQKKLAEESTPGGQAEIAHTRAETDKSAWDMAAAKGEPVYATRTDPDGTEHTVLTTKGEALGRGSSMSAVRPVTEGAVDKDQHDIKVLNDVQIKSDNVKTAAAAMDQTSWGQAAAVAKLLADKPNTTAANLLQSKVMKNATPQTRQYVIAVMSLRESSMGMQKVLTGSARANESQIEALQNTLPGVEPDSTTVHQKLQAFDQNLGMLNQGLPENSGVKSQVHGAEISVTDPNGGMHFFKDQASANKFKQAAGIK